MRGGRRYRHNIEGRVTERIGVYAVHLRGVRGGLAFSCTCPSEYSMQTRGCVALRHTRPSHRRHRSSGGSPSCRPHLPPGGRRTGGRYPAVSYQRRVFGCRHIDRPFATPANDGEPPRPSSSTTSARGWFYRQATKTPCHSSRACGCTIPCYFLFFVPLGSIAANDRKARNAGAASCGRGLPRAPRKPRNPNAPR